MAQRFDETVNIQTINTQSGAAQGAYSLAARLEAFKAPISNIQSVIGVKRGQAKAAEEEIETKTVNGQEVAVEPKKKKASIADLLLFNGAETQSYNQTLRNGYLAQLSNDNREAITNIMSQNPDNVTGFNTSAEGYINGVLEGVDPAVRTQVAAQLDGLTTDARIRVQAASQAKFAAEAQAAISAQLTTLTDAGLRAARDGDQVAASEAIIEYSGVVGGMVSAGQITQAAADLMVNNTVKTVAAENIISGIRRTALEEGGAATAAQMLLDFRDSSPQGFTIEEQDQIYTTMVSELNGALNMKAKIETDQQESLKARQEKNSSDLYLGVIGGNVSPSEISASLARGDITQAQATPLMNILNTRGAGIDDFSLINDITESIRNGVSEEEIRQEITTNTGIRLTAERAYNLTKLLNDSMDRESPLQTSEAKRAESFIVQSMRVTGPFGALDSEAERRLANAKREYADGVLAGGDPWEIADSLVDKDAFNRAPEPMFGTKEDLTGALEELNTQFDAGNIAEEDYNYQYYQLQSLIEMKATLESYEKARREATSGR